MTPIRRLFLEHVAQTSPAPLALEIERAKGIYLYDTNGKSYTDLISGISVSTLGHCHPKVVEAINKQSQTYMHLMVYGEYAQAPQTELAHALSKLLPETLNSVYFTNSGAEATEGAMKLAKRVTGRTEIISFKNAYHGSTQGALSIMGNEEFKRAFRPLLPDTRILEFNNEQQLEQITERTACVVIEPVQAEAGVIVPQNDFLKKVRKRCTETGTLLILDEIQTGFGRCGTFFAFEQFSIVPDVLLLAKAMGGGMPIGAFISSKKNMDCFSNNPVLGHITTFGGNAVCCAASLATLKEISEQHLFLRAKEIEKIVRGRLQHPLVKEIRAYGALIAVEFGDTDLNMQIISKCIEKGVITDWFLFCSTAMRIAPPLIITDEELIHACNKIVEALQETQGLV
ncbi:MAG: aspartate aminotransferase family protein [Bacteroidetes bacterium]|jgi:acetylornithine/succinyldiaminopimelate/putrescine aminotransferase|nr:aspartate aminotransferase family protein [Bacteroidota bacterium]